MNPLLIMIVLFSLVFGSGIWLLLKTKRFLQTARGAEGAIVGQEGYLTIDMRGGTNAPIIVFKVEGKSYTLSGRVTLPGKRSIGKKVHLLYDPNNPSDAVIDSWIELHAPWMIMLSTGALGLGGMLFTMIFY